MLKAFMIFAALTAGFSPASADQDTLLTANEAEDVMDMSQYELHPARRSLQDEPPGFSIDLAFVGSMTDAQKNGFLAARDKWMSIITADSATTACVAANTKICGVRFTQRTCIDDLLIIARVSPIDGVGRILGQAGPCGTLRGKVRIGTMQFDSADANMLIDQDLWLATVLHEMGHVLGIGTLWDSKKLITRKGQKRPFFYFGKNGNEGLNTTWGPNAGRIRVEDKGGPGTARGHWKEAVYDTELMTGYIESEGTPMPLSLFTVRSLQDLGYTVDVTQADPFPKPTLSGRRLRTKKNKIHLHNDIKVHKFVELTEFTPKKGREDEAKAEQEAWEALQSATTGEDEDDDNDN